MSAGAIVGLLVVVLVAAVVFIAATGRRQDAPMPPAGPPVWRGPPPTPRSPAEIAADLARIRTEPAAEPKTPEGPAAPTSTPDVGGVREVVIRETIERQILVQRCRFCSKLTPVDLTS